MKRINMRLLALWVALVLTTAFLVLPGSAFAANQVADPAPSGTWAQSDCTYTVSRGDILSRIAVRYGTNYRALAALNGLSNPNKIFAGMVLRVPCAASANPPGTGTGQLPSGICSYYVVRAGDYLKSIAARFGTTWQAIAGANRLVNPNLIHPGLRLAIPCGSTPPAGTTQWKTWTSARHQYVVNYPADWSIDVQTTGPGHDPEYVYLRPPSAGLPQVQILALKDAPPITGFENCDKNLQFKGVAACSISLPRGQIPATQLLVFQKGASHYQIAMQYEAQSQLAVFEEIVKSFQFKP